MYNFSYTGVKLKPVVLVVVRMEGEIYPRSSYTPGLAVRVGNQPEGAELFKTKDPGAF